MIAISRFRVPEDQTEDFLRRADEAVEALSGAAGFRTADVARNLDDPTLWTIATRWQNVGSYRRALSSYASKLAAVPLLQSAIDEPSAYEEPANLVL